ncbi:MAG: alanine--tRNA ligase [Gemmatimonadales bacterium]|nr:alanine--tRNA ligase [Gemmatimonadales bacterium]
MRASLIRQKFVDFFAQRGHTLVASSSLVPADDPTLLFTNAGMVQFKRAFLGQEARAYNRAVTAQKCVRAGGKHNDLEQVGHTLRHHTFFEMLGNFSFGDYFKRDAIAFAWEFVTGRDWLAIPADRLRVTVHHSDDEARALWRDVSGLADDRIYGLGDKDNFWQMGDTGPCGPCSEIYVDLDWTPGMAPRALSQEEFEARAEAGRFLEIWNLVFMQFDRSADGTLTPLPKPSVDTGAGLERIAAVLQGEDDNFHTDLFAPLLRTAGELVGRPYDRAAPDRASYRVLADHARAVSFLLADGVYPGNDGRGYVLRRILRRAVRHAWLLGRRDPTLAPLTQVVVDELGDVYPEIRAKASFIEEVTRQEEERFLETIEGGLRRLEELFVTGATTIDGDEVFRLYDTFGFPVDLTQLIAAERGVGVDVAGFERALGAQRSRSRAARKAAAGGGPVAKRAAGGKWTSVRRGRQKFAGYDATACATEILRFRQADGRVELVLKEVPFYAESGGQVSDTGRLAGAGWTLAVDSVRKEEGTIVVGGAFDEPFEPTPVEAAVDEARRRDIERNHSATHLAHWALRKFLGTHVRQQGSLVEPGRLRFDFSHHGPIEPAQLHEIEHAVNELVWANHEVSTRQMPYPEALQLGAMAFFSEKYGDVVRVVRMGDSIELCGGTHVRSTGQVGLFRVAGQGGVAAGVRRIEAVTGPRAYAAVAELEERLRQVGEALKAQPEHLLRKAEQLVAEKAKLEERLAAALKGGGAGAGLALTNTRVGALELVWGRADAIDREELGRIADDFRATRKSGAALLIATGSAYTVALTDDLVAQGRKAGDLLNKVAAVSGGKGGGRPHLASGSVGDPSRVDAAVAAAPALLAEWLGA